MVKNGFVYVLSTCSSNMKIGEGLCYPKEGMVEDLSWVPDSGGNGKLAGLLWGAGDGSVLDWSPDAVWLVVRVGEVSENMVVCSGSVQFGKGYVEYAGERNIAIDYIVEKGADPLYVVGATMEVGDDKVALTGYRGNSICGNGGFASSGVYGCSVAGNGGRALSKSHGKSISGKCGWSISGVNGKCSAGVEGNPGCL